MTAKSVLMRLQGLRPGAGRVLPFAPLTAEFAACSKPPSRNNHHKALYPRTQQRVRWGWELNLNHAIMITRSP